MVAGYGVGSGFDSVKELCPESNVPEGFSVIGGKERDGILLAIKDEKEIEVSKQITSWLNKLQLK